MSRSPRTVVLIPEAPAVSAFYHASSCLSLAEQSALQKFELAYPYSLLYSWVAPGSHPSRIEVNLSGIFSGVKTLAVLSPYTRGNIRIPIILIRGVGARNPCMILGRVPRKFPILSPPHSVACGHVFRL